jgi:hypothetical protein
LLLLLHSDPTYHKYLKFSTAAVLKLLPLPPVVAIGTAMEATGTDVVWSIPAASLVTQFTGVQFQIQAEAMILNQDNLKTDNLKTMLVSTDSRQSR